MNRTFIELITVEPNAAIIVKLVAYFNTAFIILTIWILQQILRCENNKEYTHQNHTFAYFKKSILKEVTILNSQVLLA